jgi:hypothetical protein
MEVHVFRDSFGPFVALLNEHHVKYTMRESRSGIPMASASGVIEILQSPAMWAALATVICSFLKNRRSRKVIITLNDNTLVHAEGLSPKEVAKLLAQARSLSAIETKKKDETITREEPPEDGQ